MEAFHNSTENSFTLTLADNHTHPPSGLPELAAYGPHETSVAAVHHGGRLTPQMDQQRLATPARGFDKIGEYCVPGPSTRNGFYLETSKSAPSLPSSDIPSNFLPLHCTFPGRESNPVNTFPPSFSAVDGSCLALQYPQINSFDGNGYYFPQVMSGAQDFAARSSHSNGTAGIIQGFDNRQTYCTEGYEHGGLMDNVMDDLISKSSHMPKKAREKRPCIRCQQKDRKKKARSLPGVHQVLDCPPAMAHMNLQPIQFLQASSAVIRSRDRSLLEDLDMGRLRISAIVDLPTTSTFSLLRSVLKHLGTLDLSRSSPGLPARHAVEFCTSPAHIAVLALLKNKRPYCSTPPISDSDLSTEVSLFDLANEEALSPEAASAMKRMVQAVGGTLQSFMSRQTEIDMFRTLQEAIRQHETDLTLLAQHLLRAFIWARHTRARARESGCDDQFISGYEHRNRQLCLILYTHLRFTIKSIPPHESFWDEVRRFRLETFLLPTSPKQLEPLHQTDTEEEAERLISGAATDLIREEVVRFLGANTDTWREGDHNISLLVAFRRKQ
ncbi:MAG: hypothetical protein MMC33_001679 [Icmadophila ericetorum]|nr:hypothetical protein [Icmadophila ericetorum]